MKISRPFERFFSFLKSLFLNGLFTLLPITATIFFASFTYNLVVGWLGPVQRIQPGFLQRIPGSELIIFIVVVMLVGAILKFLVLAPLVHRLERLIDKIPLIRTVYSSSKTVVEFFNLPRATQEQQKVVLVEYPRKGVYSIGFQLETTRKSYQPLINEAHKRDDEYIKVFVPSSPAPTTGYFLLVPRSEIIDTPITFEEAIKAIVSCGLITPDSLSKRSS